MFWQTLAIMVIGLAGAGMVLRPLGRPGAIALATLALGWGLLLGTIAGPVTGVVQATAGTGAAVVLWLAEPAADEPASRRRTTNGDEPGAGFRLVTAMLGAVVAYGLARTVPLQPGTSLIGPSWAWYWSTIAALVVLLLGRNPARSAAGLLLLCSCGPLLAATLSTPESLGAIVAGGAAALALALLLGRVLPPAKESPLSADSGEKTS